MWLLQTKCVPSANTGVSKVPRGKGKLELLQTFQLGLLLSNYPTVGTLFQPLAIGGTVALTIQRKDFGWPAARPPAPPPADRSVSLAGGEVVQEA